MKPTKRKAFNFLRSYFDVLNHLEKDEDKLGFLMSIINKQFLDQDPEDLNFLTNLCYESQRHQIESSVKGWKRASNTTLLGDPMTAPPTTLPTTPKEEEEKEEEKEKEQYTIKDKFESEKLFLLDWNELRLKHLNKKSAIKVLDTDSREIFNDLIKNYSREEMQEAIVGLFKQKKLPNGNTSMQANPKHFLKFFNTYLTAFYDKNQELYGKEVAKEY
tara:strand:+ start:173 stop:823 length:651 start_codon:yes stop_codon:yes gene_type:complete